MTRGDATQAKPRRRAVSEVANVRRQTDSLAQQVELLQLLLTEQRQTNVLLQQLLERLPQPPL